MPTDPSERQIAIDSGASQSANEGPGRWLRIIDLRSFQRAERAWLRDILRHIDDKYVAVIRRLAALFHGALAAERPRALEPLRFRIAQPAHPAVAVRPALFAAAKFGIVDGSRQ